MPTFDDSVQVYVAARAAFREANGNAMRADAAVEAAKREQANANKLVALAREKLARAAERIEPELGKEFRSDTGAALVKEKAPVAPVASAESLPHPPMPVEAHPEEPVLPATAGGL